MTKPNPDDYAALNTTWLPSIVQTLQAAEEMNKVQTEFFMEFDEIRLWHGDGWSPGFIVTRDDEFVFVPDYKDR
jgi:hypothetical protein